MKISDSSTQHDVSQIAVLTLVIWLGCSIVGGLGFALPYARPHPGKPAPEPIRVEQLNVELADEPTPALQPPHSTTAQPDTLTQPQIPRPTSVVEPSPAIAFVLPVQGPVQVMEPRQAAYTPSAAAASTEVMPVPQTLTFGQGEGRQPAPEYPPRARYDGQSGNVTVRFTVAADGHVLAAEVVSPSRWPLLNNAALRAVKERWRFAAGKLRAYDVTIRFELRS